MLPSDEGATSAGSGQTVVERPPPGPERGQVAAPAWVVAAVGAVVVAFGLGHLGRRWRRRGRA